MALEIAQLAFIDQAPYQVTQDLSDYLQTEEMAKEMGIYEDPWVRVLWNDMHKWYSEWRQKKN